jgi:hypothetical protein
MIVPAVALLVVTPSCSAAWFADRGEVVVWQVTHPIPAGKSVTEADLRKGTVAGAAGQGRSTGDQQPRRVGGARADPRRGVADPEVLTQGPALPSHGEALVGVALAPGAAPAEGLVAGDMVRVVRIPVSGEEASLRPGGRVVRAAAPVWAARNGKDGATTVTLRVPIAYADLIAGLSARGAIALERVAGSG